eukprot:10009823-Karenia_brevis.AAC.1
MYMFHDHEDANDYDMLMTMMDDSDEACDEQLTTQLTMTMMTMTMMMIPMMMMMMMVMVAISMV